MWKRGHDPATLEPQRHQPPAGWDAATFERVTDALAAVLIAGYRRGPQGGRERGRPPRATAGRPRAGRGSPAPPAGPAGPTEAPPPRQCHPNRAPNVSDEPKRA